MTKGDAPWDYRTRAYAPNNSSVTRFILGAKPILTLLDAHASRQPLVRNPAVVAGRGKRLSPLHSVPVLASRTFSAAAARRVPDVVCFGSSCGGNLSSWAWASILMYGAYTQCQLRGRDRCPTSKLDGRRSKRAGLQGADASMQTVARPHRSGLPFESLWEFAGLGERVPLARIIHFSCANLKAVLKAKLESYRGCAHARSLCCSWKHSANDCT